MVKLILSLLYSGLLLSSTVTAHFIKDAPKNDISTDFISHKVSKQVAGEEPADPRGFKVVIVYVKPTNCPVVTEKFEKTSTEFDYVTFTSTTDIYVTKMPESCPDYRCEPIVDKECVTRTYTSLSTRTYVTDGANSGGNNGAYTRSEVFGDTNYGEPPSSLGSSVLHQIQDIGEAHTSTILTDGPTTSIDYVRETAKLETKPDPILVLGDLSGPNTISIDTEWSLSLSTESSSTHSTGHSSHESAGGVSVTDSSRRESNAGVEATDYSSRDSITGGYGSHESIANTDAFETTHIVEISETTTTVLERSTSSDSTYIMSMNWNESTIASTTIASTANLLSSTKKSIYSSEASRIFTSESSSEDSSTFSSTFPTDLPTFSSNFLSTESPTDAHTYSSVESSTYLQTEPSTDSSSFSLADPSTYSSSESSMHTSVESSASSSVESSKDSLIYSSLESSTYSSSELLMDASTYSSAVSSADSSTFSLVESSTFSSAESVIYSSSELSIYSSSELSTYSSSELSTDSLTYSSAESSTISSVESLSFSSRDPSTSHSSSQSQTVSETSESSALPTLVIEHEKSNFANVNLFDRISDSDPGQLFTRKDHPLAMPQGVSNKKPIQTNKFYSNLFLGNQNQTVFTYPYEVYWERTSFHGMAIQYPDPKRRVFAGTGINGANQYYFNGIRSPGVFAGATTISEGSDFMSVSQMSELSVNVQLSATPGDSTNFIEFPLVEGMGMVTSIYHGNLIPRIVGNGGIGSFFEETYNASSANIKQKTKQYRVVVSNNESWLILVTIPSSQEDFDLKLEDGNLVGSRTIDGLIIQYALAPDQQISTRAGTSNRIYYGIAGKYVTDAKVSGEVEGVNANYRIKYETEGESLFGDTLVFAFPHHIDILDTKTADRYSGIQVPSTTKGIMRGYLTDELGFSDAIDQNINWLPYVKKYSPDLTYTREQLELIREAAVNELKDVDIVRVLSNIGSQYFMGKALDKYAYLMYVLHDIVGDEELAEEVLATLKIFFKNYKSGSVNPSLYYDTKFKGVTSDSADPNADFGNGYYNDHNFHYSYSVHAASLIGYLDSKKGGSWVAENKEFVNSLVRDVANPSDDDTFFPVSRSFDWFQGHSWAKGLFESQDGKDQESSSEDVHFSYAMKMWGKVSGDKSMEARGSLMLKIQERSFNSYFLYTDDNNIVPKQILNNMVSGIFFENKVDYTVYFSKEVSPGVFEALTEYKHGIQMIPMTPALGSVRSSVFAEQEWNQILKDIDGDGGWAGILNSNRVLFDPSASWDFFANSEFDPNRLDGGQSRAWTLAFAAPFKNEVDGL